MVYIIVHFRCNLVLGQSKIQLSELRPLWGAMENHEKAMQQKIISWRVSFWPLASPPKNVLYAKRDSVQPLPGCR